MKNFKQMLESFLTSEAYTHTSIHYDMNAVKIRLHQNLSESRYISFYIYHPWRISLNGELINSSADYPHPKKNESDEEHKTKYESYCQTTKFLERFSINKINIDAKTNDLSVFWENNAVLESPTFSPKDYSYHIYDYINGEGYDVYYNRIEKDTFDVIDRPDQNIGYKR